ncbi:MAG: exodeoxyribonuclease VII small subunit [Myxococcota bacterium]
MEAGSSASNGEPSFEQVLARLQELVEQLERGDLPLERSLAIFEEGVRLSRLGARRLDEAERRVEELLSDDEGVRTRPLEDEETESP